MVDVEKTIEKKAEETELSESELRDAYETVKKKIDDKLSNKSEGFRKRSAIRKMVDYANGVSNLVEKEIRVIAKGQRRDTVAYQRQQAKQMFDENPQKAIEDEVTDRSGNPLWQSGRNEGEKMPEHNWRQDTFGVDSEGNMVQLACTQDELFDLMDDVKEYSKVTGKFLDRSDFGDRVKEYRLSRYTDIDVEEDAIDDQDAVELLKDTEIYESPYDLREITEKMDYPEIASLMTVDYYDDEIPEDSNRRITLSSFDREVRITGWIPDEWDIDFENGSEVYVLGSTKFGDMWREDLEQEPLQFATLHKIIPDPEGTLEEGEELPNIV